MCGICGAFVYRGSEALDFERLRAARDYMTPRGPNGSGEWASANRAVWFGHRRLSIIDLSERGAQPMMDVAGELVVTFNGEIYNFRELRRDLEARGHIFRSDSDTEVLIELYRAKGPDFVADLRGMFAFALWDTARGRLLLARDPYGIKPLYYADNGRMVKFASSVKALTSSGLVSSTLSPAGLVGFYVFGSVPEPWTIERDIRAVPAGTIITVDERGTTAPSRYYSITSTLGSGERAAAGLSSGGAEVLVVEARAALLDSVRHHLVADVPVGAFLSAGVDSGALVGLMRDAGQSNIRTITLAYDELLGSAADEAPLAEVVARQFGTNHTTRRLMANELHDDLPRIFAAMDQPSIDGINTWFVAKAAHEAGLKVAISGVGGDELFGGYDTFRRVPNLARRLALPTRLPLVAQFARNAAYLCRWSGLPLHPKLAGLLSYGGTLHGAYILVRGLFMPDEICEMGADPDFMRAGLKELQPVEMLESALRDGPRSEAGKVAALESSIYLRNQLLRDADWASMAHSLEVRTPLVDSALLTKLSALIAALPSASGKMLLANAPASPLPREVIDRRKTGFSIPLEKWLGGEALRGARGEVFMRRWARRIGSNWPARLKAAEAGATSVAWAS
jgi:asparagine synthase (glutamine-hydrolysing)